MITNQWHLQELMSYSPTIKARVELYNGSTLAATCTCDDVLKSLTVEKEGENKFFGFGLCQKLNMALMGQNTPLTITKDHDIKVAFGVQGDYLYPFPVFHATEASKDAETDEITLVAYDTLYKATEYTVSDLALEAPYTMRQFAEACAQLLGIDTINFAFTDSALDLIYQEGANFEGSETLRVALNAIAEATQAIYYINNHNELVFVRLDKDEVSLTIDRNNYISLKNGEPYVLSKIAHVTELGDNVAPESSVAGVTQYIRDNPFWELREDITTLVDNAQAVVEGISMTPFECEWFGNYLLEPGDKIELITRNGAVITTYFLKDSVTYNGSLSESTSWTYEDNSSESETNPTTLGDVVNQATARVDKVNLQIELKVQSATKDAIEGNKAAVDEEIKNLSWRQSMISQTATEVAIRVDTLEADGVTKVKGTGYKFDEEGFTISKQGASTSTQITEDGMVVNNNAGTAVLSANSDGVTAHNLRSNYIWIGEHSRFEDYEGTRTGCFWIGD